MNSVNETISAPQHDRHLIEVADQTLTYRQIHIDDLTPSGRQISTAAGFKPAQNPIVLNVLANGELEDIRPDETVNLRTAQGRFIVVESDRSYQFTLDGVQFGWPCRVVSGGVLRKLGAVPAEKEIYFARQNEPDVVLADSDQVDLDMLGVESFHSQESHGNGHDHHHEIHITVDGEPYETRNRHMTPNEIIHDFGGKDTSTNYLVQIEGHRKISFEGKGSEPIRLHDGMKFQIISTGPTPVSDDRQKVGVDVFVSELCKLGFKPNALPEKFDHITFDYQVETGKFAGESVKIGFIVPADFPITPPSGPHISPHIHPIQTSGTHPAGAVHQEQALPFQEALGGNWQYWSRPIQDWATSKKSVAIYMSHIWRLWDSQ